MEIVRLILLLMNLIVLLTARQPHIILIVADDYGWNDIGYHGNQEVETPNLDQLAGEGIKLENYYVQPVCTPTRSQLLSGKYQIHTGLQHKNVLHCQPNGLPLDHPTIADQLKSVGYATHLVGKWHLGFYKKEYTPTYRGFDSYFGFLGGMEDYFNHSRCSTGFCGIDFRENGRPAAEYSGQYTTHLFTEQAENVINNHNSSQPMFLYLAYNAPHTPLQAPQHYIDRFKDVEDAERRIYLAMVAAMDEGIRNVTATLKQNNMWENTILIFTTDNGGDRVASNLPLRGGKASHWEGGIRGVGFIAGKYMNRSGEINRQLLHVSDWYPTILSLADGNSSSVRGLDGFDQWNTITQNYTNPRREILINIDELSPKKGSTLSSVFDTSVRSALRLGDWKILTGEPQRKRNNRATSVTSMYNSQERDLTTTNENGTQGVINPDNLKNVYLFNIAQDPEEKTELSAQYPEIVDRLLQRLSYYNSTAVLARFPEADPKCDPSNHGGFWSPWIEE